MARARMVKPELRTSTKVASWPIELRYFWVLLWGYVDDHGKAKDHPLLVKADCFPLDVDVTAETVDEWLWALSDAQVIVRYTVDGTDFLQIVNWADHQKPQHRGKDEYPDYSPEYSIRREFHESLMKVSGGTHETLTPKLSRVKLNRDMSTDGGQVSYPNDFEAWWVLYPRKEAKGAALKAWTSALKRIDIETLMDRVTLYAGSELPDRQYIPLPATWLNADRWNDDVKPVTASLHHPPEDNWMYE
jgi:hypothetical protein